MILAAVGLNIFAGQRDTQLLQAAALYEQCVQAIAAVYRPPRNRNQALHLPDPSRTPRGQKAKELTSPESRGTDIGTGNGEDRIKILDCAVAGSWLPMELVIAMEAIIATIKALATVARADTRDGVVAVARFLTSCIRASVDPWLCVSAHRSFARKRPAEHWSMVLERGHAENHLHVLVLDVSTRDR